MSPDMGFIFIIPHTYIVLAKYSPSGLLCKCLMEKTSHICVEIEGGQARISEFIRSVGDP